MTYRIKSLNPNLWLSQEMRSIPAMQYCEWLRQKQDQACRCGDDFYSDLRRPYDPDYRHPGYETRADRKSWERLNKHRFGYNPVRGAFDTMHERMCALVKQEWQEAQFFVMRYASNSKKCAACGLYFDEPANDTKSCNKCRLANAQKLANMRERDKAEKICVRCHKSPVRLGCVTCQPCADILTRNVRKRRNDPRYCHACGKTLDEFERESGYRNCDGCRKRRVEKKRRWRNKCKVSA